MIARRISIFLGDEHVGAAEVVFGESQWLQEGRVYRPLVVSSVLTTNALAKVAGLSFERIEYNLIIEYRVQYPFLRRSDRRTKKKKKSIFPLERFGRSQGGRAVSEEEERDL